MSVSKFIFGTIITGGVLCLLDRAATNRVLTNNFAEELAFANQRNQAFCGYLRNNGNAMRDDQLNEGLRMFLDSVEESQRCGRERISEIRGFGRR
ncbi:hypothetical protein QUF72_01530 [Desulfobacterales bacterium HSG2]|nr:hypothetical protein [Desulfobacterales bacterium HSG2]